MNKTLYKYLKPRIKAYGSEYKPKGVIYLGKTPLGLGQPNRLREGLYKELYTSRYKRTWLQNHERRNGRWEQ